MKGPLCMNTASGLPRQRRTKAKLMEPDLSSHLCNSTQRRRFCPSEQRMPLLRRQGPAGTSWSELDKPHVLLGSTMWWGERWNLQGLKETALLSGQSYNNVPKMKVSYILGFFIIILFLPVQAGDSQVELQVLFLLFNTFGSGGGILHQFITCICVLYDIVLTFSLLEYHHHNYENAPICELVNWEGGCWF